MLNINNIFYILEEKQLYNKPKENKQKEIFFKESKN